MTVNLGKKGSSERDGHVFAKKETRKGKKNEN